jgi:DNA primase
MKLPQSFIEELKSRLRISEVIGQVLPIRRAGREFHALCPFHKEKTPSFTVNDEKGFYHCFGCGAHGDVIGFVKNYEHLGYMEAIEKLASQAGLTMPQLSREAQEQEDKTAVLQRVLEVATSWFEAQLELGREAEIARKYIAERGLNPDIVARFRLGYAPADRDMMKQALATKGITEAQMIEVGLLIKVEDRAPYSRFRRRLIFPIRDRKSRVVGFGGRVLPGEPQADAPKYLNSPETPVFHKGRMLYNYDLARRAAYEGGQLIIAEGYMDVLALAQAGYTYAVAPLGTAVTEEQLQLCWQMVPSPILCLDGDSAGARAMQRAMQLALPLLVPGKTVQFATMPKGEDPDSLLRHLGKPAMDGLLAGATPLADKLWAEHMQRSDASTPEAKAAQEAALMQAIERIKHPSVQHYYRRAMREKLRGEFVPFRKGETKPQQAQAKIPAMPPLSRDTAAQLMAPMSKILALVMVHPALLEEATAEEAWLCLPVAPGWQMQAHQRMGEFLMLYPGAGHTALMQHVYEELSPEAASKLNTALHEMGIDGALDDDTSRVLQAEHLWPEILNDISRITLQAEFSIAEAELARDMTDENFKRMVTLKAQLEALERERSRFYRDDAMLDVM